MTDYTKCKQCLPDIDYLCMIHRPENYCVGCKRTDKKLRISAMGILCGDCMARNGMVFLS